MAQSQPVGSKLGGNGAFGFHPHGQGRHTCIFGFRVSATYFDVLGVHARLGRTFLANEDEPQADPVVVLSYGLWQRLSGESGLIGQKLTLSNERYTVIGVMPPDFWSGQRNSNIWIPLRLSASERANRTRPYLAVIARLKPGVSLPHAESEMLGIARQLDRQSSTPIKNRGMRILSLAESYRPSYLSTLLMIQGAAGLVLLIACANAAHLFLVGRREIQQGRPGILDAQRPFGAPAVGAPEQVAGSQAARDAQDQHQQEQVRRPKTPHVCHERGPFD